MASPSRSTGTSGGGTSTPGMPRWVKVLGIIAIVLVLLLVFAHLTGIGGEHGPGRHLPSSNLQDTASAASAVVNPGARQ